MRTNPLLAGASDPNGDPGPERASAPGPEPQSQPNGAAASESHQNCPSASAPHGAVCTIGLCPICTLVTAFGDVRPELTEHLLLAGREILIALKILIDARLQAEDAPASPPPPAGLEHISID
jgi:hypothetical protein